MIQGIAQRVEATALSITSWLGSFLAFSEQSYNLGLCKQHTRTWRSPGPGLTAAMPHWKRHVPGDGRGLKTHGYTIKSIFQP